MSDDKLNEMIVRADTDKNGKIYIIIIIKVKLVIITTFQI